VPPARIDSPALSMILLNLVLNAEHALASVPDARINMRVAARDGRVMISLSDNGPGIPEQERDKVLERFYRPLGTQASGSGLGLSIVKRIAEVHDAALQILPMNEGQGLRVTVSFKP
ncbi:MAG: ATP-binding protein, partial [Ktedonobacteraceae bacterium]